jgi:hypothetical protein
MVAMDFWKYEGDRSTMLPAEVLRESFGYVDPALPLLIGQIVMLSGLIEAEIANVAMSVENKEQNYYLQSFAATNRKVWANRASKFDSTILPKESRDVITAALEEARTVLEERNEIAHRVWSVPTGETWGGYKGTRRGPETGDGAALQIGWRDYGPDEMSELIRRMAVCLSHLHDAVARATSLPRLP